MLANVPEWERLIREGRMRFNLTDKEEDELMEEEFGKEAVGVFRDPRQRLWYELAAAEVGLLRNVLGLERQVRVEREDFGVAVYATGCIPPHTCIFFSQLWEQKPEHLLKVLLPPPEGIHEASLLRERGGEDFIVVYEQIWQSRRQLVGGTP